ncbi:SDR family oxidoreductase [Thermus oshimai]
MTVLVTGATGYVGGRLVPRLLEGGCRVRVLVRNPSRLLGRAWAERVEVVRGDLGNLEDLRRALRGVDTAYYLVHAMLSEEPFGQAEERQALAFAQVAKEEGLAHVVYLGGLLPRGGQPSPHLRSRARVGEILRAHIPTTEFRAGPIVGSGSASFEMVRYLTERLPVMVAPRWILNPVSPIAIRDVLSYLVLALRREPMGVVEIGGPPLSFKGMMETYAMVRGLRRLILPIPVLTPRLAALWVGLVTPIPNRLALPLVEGILYPLVADTRRAQDLFPEVKPLPYRKAVELALERTTLGEVETRWSGALFGQEFLLEDREGIIREVRSLSGRASPELLFQTFSGLGGERGWLVWNWAWAVRGLLDRLLGGPGLRRGRRHPQQLLPGDAVDFWRVERLEPPRLLRLRAEMRLPGRAWLEWQALEEDGGSRLVQTAYFEPLGLTGFLYWWLLYPIHARMFSDLARAIVREAEAASAKPPW